MVLIMMVVAFHMAVDGDGDNDGGGGDDYDSGVIDDGDDDDGDKNGDDHGDADASHSNADESTDDDGDEMFFLYRWLIGLSSDLIGIGMSSVPHRNRAVHIRCRCLVQIAYFMCSCSAV